jgi:peptide deformylase
MAIDIEQLRIIHFPDPVLRQRAEPVAEITDEVRAVAARMLVLMHDANGAGLAAPQVGLSWRLFVTAAGEEDDEDRVYVNPVLSDLVGPPEGAEEGCLSLPGITAEIRRPTTATVTARDLGGDTFTRTSDDWMARVWQHEYDHLEGTLILDRMTPMSRLATRKAIKELKAAAKQ